MQVHVLDAIDAVCSHPELLIEHYAVVLSTLLPSLSAAGVYAERVVACMQGRPSNAVVLVLSAARAPVCWLGSGGLGLAGCMQGVPPGDGCAPLCHPLTSPSARLHSQPAVASQRESADTRFCCLKLLCDVVLQVLNSRDAVGCSQQKAGCWPLWCP